MLSLQYFLNSLLHDNTKPLFVKANLDVNQNAIKIKRGHPFLNTFTTQKTPKANFTKKKSSTLYLDFQLLIKSNFQRHPRISPISPQHEEQHYPAPRRWSRSDGTGRRRRWTRRNSRWRGRTGWEVEFSLIFFFSLCYISKLIENA